VAPASLTRFKDKLRARLRGGRGRNLRRQIAELSPLLRGWVNYFRLAEVKGVFEVLDGWLRRQLRDIRWRQWKRPCTRCGSLIEMRFIKSALVCRKIGEKNQRFGSNSAGVLGRL
jgi:RNA-directed DNA polymerase